MTLEAHSAVSTTVAGAARLRTYVSSARAADDAVPVVFLHADVADSRMWEREMAALAPGRRCVAFDRRGFGGTPAAHEEYANVDDTIAVMDATGIARAVLVGCSNGGRVALDTGLAHPTRVAGLVLVCAGIGGAPEGDAWRTNPRMAELYRRWLEAEQNHDRETLASLTTQVWLDGPLEDEGRVRDPVRSLFRDMVARAQEAPEDEALKVAPATAYDLLATVAVPTLVAWGPLDVPDVTAAMRHAATTIPGAESFEVPGTAHLPNLERPDLFVPRLERFVAAIR